MKLLDTNILIYAGEAQFATALLPYVTDINNCVSAISMVETLGYHKITPMQQHYFYHLFKILKTLPVDDSVISKAIQIRQTRKISLGDSIIAATALIHNLDLITRNVDDFGHIPGLTVINPI